MLVQRAVLGVIGHWAPFQTEALMIREYFSISRLEALNQRIHGSNQIIN